MKFIESARTWMHSRRTVNELSNLSNDALADIGLTRFDIPTVARRLAR
ncbi:MAG: DUF1127 domain-containing protein [Rhizobiales bacterium]|nr:DUF1127 domain-containing protein [Hyphomicrobiales bacterium]